MEKPANARPLVIRHGACRDGFCASWVVWRHVPEAEFFDGFYGQPAPLDLARGRQVLVVDFTYPRDQMMELAGAAATLTIIDHHKTAEEALAGFATEATRKLGKPVSVIFDMKRSGAGLAWDTYRPVQSAARPWIVDYVEDRDLWARLLPSTDDINAYVSTLEFEFGAWEEAAKMPINDVERLGRVVHAKTRQYVREVSKNARRVTFAMHPDIPLVNAPQVDISELLDHLCAGVPFAMGWWQRADGVFQYSLRSRAARPDEAAEVDVSNLAKAYGGGGHRNAAGFQSPTLLF